jgi:hypothetical protein
LPTKNPDKQSVFLSALSNCGQVKDAAIAAQINRGSHYYWMDHDPAYPALFAKAKLMAIDALEDEAVERAIVGVFEPTTYKGAFVYPVIGYEKDPETKDPETKEPDLNKPIHSKAPYGIWKKSDRLLEFLLKGAKPEVYGDRGRVEVSGTVKQEHKFKGSMVELLAIYRDLSMKEANDDE